MANARMLNDAREYLQAEDLPGWLIYDYLGCNPVLAQVAPPSGHVTRPVFLFVPATGLPRLLTHHVDAGKFADAGDGTALQQVVYSSRVTLESALQDTLSGAAASPWNIRRATACLASRGSMPEPSSWSRAWVQMWSPPPT